MSDAYPEYIEELSIKIADYNPIGPACLILLPDSIPKCNNDIINMQNNDNWCFGWCVLGSLHLVKTNSGRNPHRIYAKYINEFNMEGILIPVPVSTPVYEKFEENNLEISLCVYEWCNQNKCLKFQYLSERRGANFKQVNLLVISKKYDLKNPRTHYCIIKDLHKLVYNHSKHNGRKYLCRFCLQVYFAEKGFNEHISNPKKCLGVNNAPQLPKVLLLEKRPDALQRFVDKLKEELEEIQANLIEPADIIMEKGDYKRHQTATECWISVHKGCKRRKEIIGPKWYNQPSISDNGIFKKTYNCSAHSDCNKKLQMGEFKTKVPLICHNFRGYDSHLLIEVVSRFASDKLKCIPENIGKYKAIDVGQFRFLDSFQHMAMVLDKLVKCLGNTLEKFPLTVKHFTEKRYSLDQIKLLIRKGVFSYDWINSWDKFKRTNLPRKKDFYSLLYQQNISKSDY
ncbi:3780_t:CDS:2, partial [Cetraspora pellucida]